MFEYLVISCLIQPQVAKAPLDSPRILLEVPGADAWVELPWVQF